MCNITFGDSVFCFLHFYGVRVAYALTEIQTRVVTQKEMKIQVQTGMTVRRNLRMG